MHRNHVKRCIAGPIAQIRIRSVIQQQLDHRQMAPIHRLM